MQKKLFLLDAYALIFRAYYALIRNPRMTSTGRNTNAQFGFTNTLFELIQKEKPSHMAVCFDVEGTTERHTDFADYKANRQETPEDLLAAVPDIQKIIQGLILPASTLGLQEISGVRGSNDFNEIGEINPSVRSIVAYDAESKIINTLRTNGILLAHVAPQGSFVGGQSSVVLLS